MRHLHFDSTGGASGDMTLAALIAAGADVAAIRTALAGLGLDGYELVVAEAASNGFTGTQVRVTVARHAHHPHRRLGDILAMVEGANLAAGARDLAVRTFTRLAEAEAAVHGCAREDVHFHEVGATDSIVDIAGSCVALDLLGVDTVSVGPLPLGSGTVKSAHGTLPVPAPATVRLLIGHETLPCGEEPFELVTPTGAALLMTFKSGAVPTNGGRLVRAGVAVGHRALATRPNLLRALVFEVGADQASGSGAGETCLVLECNVDDANPELLGAAVTKLMADAGAWDAFLTPVQMKKQRPGALLTVLCEPSRRDRALDVLFRETTTFGVREYLARRTMLARRFALVQTPFGEVRIKIGAWRGRDVTWAPEYEDCARCAAERGAAVRAVYEAAVSAASALRGSPSD